MPSIIIKDTEHFDITESLNVLVKKFAIVPDIRKKEFYEKAYGDAKRKMAAAKKRARKTNRMNNPSRRRSFR